jgi:ubiquinone/menaquinone biosynthesis C-methylase UbiE
MVHQIPFYESKGMSRESATLIVSLSAGAAIADVGAGTGLLTRGFLARGYNVVAVEPNPAMREACDRYCGAFERYRSVEGTAESMPLAAGSVDLVTAAQAFHWFDIERARAECLRVLEPDGRVALVAARLWYCVLVATAIAWSFFHIVWLYRFLLFEITLGLI